MNMFVTIWKLRITSWKFRVWLKKETYKNRLQLWKFRLGSKIYWLKYSWDFRKIRKLRDLGLRNALEA